MKHGGRVVSPTASHPTQVSIGVGGMALDPIQHSAKINLKFFTGSFIESYRHHVELSGSARSETRSFVR